MPKLTGTAIEHRDQRGDDGAVDRHQRAELLRRPDPSPATRGNRSPNFANAARRPTASRRRQPPSATSTNIAGRRDQPAKAAVCDIVAAGRNARGDQACSVHAWFRKAGTVPADHAMKNDLDDVPMTSRASGAAHRLFRVTARRSRPGTSSTASAGCRPRRHQPDRGMRPRPRASQTWKP